MNNTILTTIFFFLILSSASSHTQEPAIQLANSYHDQIEINQYLVSEKLDGVRAYWNGKNLISRNGNKINAPLWFVKNFPQYEVEGELWIGRGRFEETVSAVRKDNPQDRQWQKIRLMLFDAPKHQGTFVERLKFLQEIVTKVQSPYLQLIEQKSVTDHKALMQLLNQTVQAGGEGLMLHKADALYKAQRNDDLLKLKTYQDEEAVVISHIKGQGKFKNLSGAILVENKDKIRFKIGSGFSQAQRQNPPKIGSIITYKFYGKTKTNKPRFPIFLREKTDMF